MTPQIIWFLVGLAFSVLLLVAGHWAPWELSKLKSYVYGVSSLLAGFCLWRLMVGDWQSPLGLFIIAAIGGGTVWACYSLDGLATTIRAAQKAQENDPEL